MIELTNGTESNADCISPLMYYFCLTKKSINRIYVISNIFLKYLDIWTLLPVFISGIFINRKTSCISLINSEVIHEVHGVKTQIINQCNPDLPFPSILLTKTSFQPC